jgi:hypothetical protein
MDRLEIKKRWSEIKNILKEQYSQLTDKDLEYIEGQEDILMRRIQSKTGRSFQEIMNLIGNQQRGHGNS